MKMKFLALSVALALGGVAGTAQAALSVSDTGIGHALIVPYFTTQSGQHTYLNIVNTDQTNGKAVKVRFRGALDSDDVMDFQVFLSPGDVWVADVQPTPDGKGTALFTSDNSCTLPKSVGKDWTQDANGAFLPGPTSIFPEFRLKTADPIRAKEGYVEIFNMADIPPKNNTLAAGISDGTQSADANALYTAIKHVKVDGKMVAPCPDSDGAVGVLGLIQENNAASFNDALDGSVGSQTSLQLNKPTGTLFGNWSILNTSDNSAYSAWMTTLVAADATRLVYSSQNGTINVVAADPATQFDDRISSTADAVLLNSSVTKVSSLTVDFPDMSTPYEQTTTTASDQARVLSNALMRSATTGEFMSDAVGGVIMGTDWVFSQPTRRYHVAGRGSKYGTATITGYTPTLPYTNVVTYADDGIGACVRVGGYSYRDRNEAEAQVAGGSIIISPAPPVVISELALCNETGVISLNNGAGVTAPSSAVLKSPYSTVKVGNGYAGAVDVTFGEGFNKYGWATLTLTTSGNAYGLPLLGQQFSKFVAGANAAAAGYGVNFDHRFAKGTAVAP